MEELNITLDDVALAIKILQTFLNKMDEAERILRRVQRYSSYGGRYGGYGFSMEEIVSMAMEMEKRKKTTVEEKTEELTPEELERFRRIAQKYKTDNNIK